MKGSFSQVAEICYTQLNLLLLAIEARKYEGGEIYINPRKKIINPNAIGTEKKSKELFCQEEERPFIFLFLLLQGLFMTDSADSAKRAWFYCRKCHANIKSEKQVGRKKVFPLLYPTNQYVLVVFDSEYWGKLA